MNPRKTAFLVIQGLSSQKPLEPTDSFTRGLVASLHKSDPKTNINLAHRLGARAGEAGACVRIGIEGEQPIDVYEYYWADMTAGRASISTVIDWLLAASDGAKAFYETHPELINSNERPILSAFRNNIMETNWYLARIGGLFRAFALVDQVFPANQWIRLSGVLKAVLMPVLGFLHRQLANVLVAYLGDAAVYTQTDGNRTASGAREEVLSHSLAKLEAILQSPEAYERVIIAGHSLGSVIAYDTINRLVQHINAKPDALPVEAHRRLKGLITFGSPLDKVAFLFRFRSKGNDYVRRQLIGQRHCFRASDLDVSGYKRDDMVLDNPYCVHLDDQVVWINYWDARDIVSGHLDFYRVNENVQCEISGHRVETHEHYWDYMPMYDDILRRFLSSGAEFGA